MVEWAHPLAIAVGLLYTVGGLAKFVGLKDFFRRKLFIPWSLVFPLGFRPDPQLYSYVVGGWEAFSGFILLWPTTWSDRQACFGLILSHLLVAYNGYHTRNNVVFISGILAIVFFLWMFISSYV